jgi:DNA-directed RNA polymerase subunit RPC12/RpoP
VKIVREVELTEHRCYECGRWWAFESAIGNVNCPACSERLIASANERASQAERSMRGLRGAVTKLQAKRGGK